MEEIGVPHTCVQTCTRASTQAQRMHTHTCSMTKRVCRTPVAELWAVSSWLCTYPHPGRCQALQRHRAWQRELLRAGPGWLVTLM